MRFGWCCLLTLWLAACATVEPKPEEAAPTPEATPQENVEEAGEEKAADAAGEEAKEKKDEEPKEKPYEFLVTGPGLELFEKAVEAGRSDLDRAEQLFNEALSLDANLYQAHNNLGLIHFSRGKLDDAEAAFKKSLSIKENYDQAIVNLAWVSVRRGNLNKAKQYLWEQSQRYPESLLIKARLARVLSMEARQLKESKSRDFQQVNTEAIEAAKDVLKEDEQNTQALMALGWGFFNEDKYELASMVFNNVTALTDQEAEAFHGLALIAMSEDKTFDAKDNWRKAIQARPDFPEAHVNLGVFDLKDREFEKALDHFDKALVANPDLLAAYLNRGNALAGLKRYDEALAMYAKVEEMDPDNKEIIFNRGLIFLENVPVLEEEEPSFEQEVANLRAQTESNNKAKVQFELYKQKMGRLPKQHVVNEYLKEIDTKLVNIERAIQRAEKRKEREERRKRREEEERAEQAAEEAEAAQAGEAGTGEEGAPPEEGTGEEGAPPEEGTGEEGAPPEEGTGEEVAPPEEGTGEEGAPPEEGVQMNSEEAQAPSEPASPSENGEEAAPVAPEDPVEDY